YTIHVQHVAEALAARGHEVTVLCARHSHDLPRDETVRGVRIVRLWAPIHMSRGMVMPAYPLALFEFMRRYDLIFTNTPMLETALVALVAQITGKSVVSTHHGDLVLPPGFGNRVISGIMFELFKFMARRAHRLIAYSHDYADHSYYLLPFRDKVSVIYPPIKLPTPNSDRVALLRSQWSHNGGPIIGYSGRFVQEKRPELLIQSLEVINQKYPNARVVFAGQYDIPYENTWNLHQDIVQKYRDQLIFLGLLTDNQDMADFYAALDVMVLPSDTECFALAQVEAMLCDTPVVMTNTPGGRVPVQETGMGLIVPRGDSQAIGRAVLDILADPGRYHKSHDAILRTFNFDETISRYERHFWQAAAHSRVKLRDWAGERGQVDTSVEP
ncbi:MAG TPA: glycosyltransferase family 4 protein, partial [Aggregatilineales bacterium]|nr:glycosyltransferase family 4 protein [Aggregatilineales bacterium]